MSADIILRLNALHILHVGDARKGDGVLKSLGLAAAAVMLWSASASGAVAQSLSPWGMWDDEERTVRRAPPPDDDYFEDRRYRDRYERRYSNRRFDRYEDDDDFDDEDDVRRPNRFEIYPDDDPTADYGDDRLPQDRYRNPDQPQGAAVADGGPKPSIRSIAPPTVPFYASYASGSIVIDVKERKLYYVIGNTRAYAYPIGVGREGFSWTGTEKVSRVAEWPDWHPPAEMRQRQPELPEKMLGGLRNPLGAKAIYLGNTLYRIHGTNDAKSIGRAQSSGCFRMMNEHVTHLASLVQIGAEVSVVASLRPDGMASRGRAAAFR